MSASAECGHGPRGAAVSTGERREAEEALRLRRMAGFGREQHEVIFEGRHVGRIYLANPHDKAGVNWYWGINWFERRGETAKQTNQWDGYTDSRDTAMIAFRKAWNPIER